MIHLLVCSAIALVYCLHAVISSRFRRLLTELETPAPVQAPAAHARPPVDANFPPRRCVLLLLYSRVLDDWVILAGGIAPTSPLPPPASPGTIVTISLPEPPQVDVFPPAATA